jgi:large subunit ribosomal protein L9
MEVILREDVDHLGRAGDIVDVKAGYGRNFLLPQGLAYPATEGNKRRVAQEARRRGEMLAARKDAAEELATRLTGRDLTFQANVGEADKLFGSITAADVAAKVRAELGVDLDKRLVELAEPIRTIGVFQVPVRLHPEVRPELRVWVVKAE